MGYTCPECPEWSESIRRYLRGARVRFRAVTDAMPVGELKRKQVTATFDTLSEARRFVAEVRVEIEERGGLSARELTVEQALDQWLASRTKLRPPTRRNYEAQYKPAVDAFGNVAVRELRAYDVEKLIASMLEGGKRNDKPFGVWAIRACVGRLSQALDRCLRDGIVTTNVARLVELPRADCSGGEKLEHWKTVGHGPAAICPDLDTFRKVSDEHRDVGAWRLTLCGMTRADIMGLRWSDVDLDKG